MASLREKVKASQTLNGVSPSLALAPDQNAHVPSLGVNITGDVHNASGAKISELSKEVGITALARRVKNDHGLVGVVCDGAEELAGISSDEAAAVLAEAVEGGVAAGGSNGVGGNVDADGMLENGREGDGEETGAGVGVDEVLDGLLGLGGNGGIFSAGGSGG